MEKQFLQQLLLFHKMICAVSNTFNFIWDHKCLFHVSTLLIRKEYLQSNNYTGFKLTGSALPSPAKDFGWHDPGYIHSAIMTGLNPSSTYSYRYGRYEASMLDAFITNLYKKLRKSLFSKVILITILFYWCSSNSVDWSEQIKFSTPPSGGTDELKFVAFGDMGKTPLDASEEHYIQVNWWFKWNNI